MQWAEQKICNLAELSGQSQNLLKAGKVIFFLGGGGGPDIAQDENCSVIIMSVIMSVIRATSLLLYFSERGNFSGQLL